jgi:nucleotide-binding universal stress UspA family protein
MLKSLLLALDRTAGSDAAKAMALALARKHGARVHGVAVVDPDLIAPPEATPVSGDAYKQHKDAVIIERVHAADVEIAQAFGADCAAAGVDGKAEVVQGEALTMLNAASAAHDIVLIGNDVTFGADSAAPLISGLLRDNPRPLIVVPRAPAAGAKTLVAYDGSTPSLRALQLFCALRLRAEGEVMVTCLNPNGRLASALADAGARFLNERGYKATTRPIIGEGDPAPVLIDAAKDVGAGMIVAGAYGHRGWREWLLGSTTEHLLATSPVSLFIHH